MVDAPLSMVLLIFLLTLPLVSGCVIDTVVNSQTATSRLRRSTCERNITWEKLVELRKVMQRENIQAYIIPTSDQHLSEYTPDKDKFRQWISGFTGSAGTAVVTLNEAAVWTDGRYFNQAEKELDCNWMLKKSGMDEKTSEWLKDELSKADNVSADSFVLSHDEWSDYSKEFAAVGLNFIATSVDIAEEVWKDRPDFPNSTIWLLNTTFSGRSSDDKLQQMNSSMEEKGVEVMIITALDDVAWLTNLRADDISYVPVFISYAIYDRINNELSLYVKDGNIRMTQEAKNAIHIGGCPSDLKPCTPTTLKGYSEFVTDLAKIAPRPTWISPLSSFGVYKTYNNPETAVLDTLPIVPIKAAKNEVEKQHMINCNIKDSAILVEFADWLEDQVLSGKTQTELSAAGHLDDMRTKAELSLGPSFNTISAFGKNAAVIHYRATNSTDTPITQTSGLYLLDSGGQYYDGTTDVTRTFCYGTPQEEQINAYTRVLMGAIDLAMTVWPKGVFGEDIDSYARRYLWQDGMDYLHGTGHAIGFVLSIHENYNRIKIRSGGRCARCIPLTEGFVLSDEPGFYKDDHYGIRLETDLIVINSTKKDIFDRQYLEWMPLTLVPFEPKLIDVDLLSRQQLVWLNEYHVKVEKVTGGYLEKRGKTAALEWLKARTQPLKRTNTINTATNITQISALLLTLVIWFRVFI